MLISWHFLMVFCIHAPPSHSLPPPHFCANESCQASTYLGQVLLTCDKIPLSSRKYHFRLLLGGFLDVNPRNKIHSVWILTGDEIQFNASDIWQFLFYCKEFVKIGPTTWFFGSFWQVFCLHSLTPHELRPNFYTKWKIS